MWLQQKHLQLLKKSQVPMFQQCTRKLKLLLKEVSSCHLKEKYFRKTILSRDTNVKWSSWRWVISQMQARMKMNTTKLKARCMEMSLSTKRVWSLKTKNFPIVLAVQIPRKTVMTLNKKKKRQVYRKTCKFIKIIQIKSQF